LRSKKTTAIYTLIIGIVVSTLFSLFINYLHLKNVKLEAKVLFKQLSFDIQQTIESNIATLDSLTSFYKSSDQVQEDEFETFTSHLLSGNSGLVSLNWNPIVKGNNRKVFETEKQKELKQEFKIKEFYNNKFVDAQAQEKYIPVVFSMPKNFNPSIRGFNLLSDPIRRDAILKAENLQKTTSTAPLTLFSEDASSRQKSLILFSPVENKKGVLTGFTSAVYTVSDAFSKIMDKQSNLSQQLPFIVQDKNELIFQTMPNIFNEHNNDPTEFHTQLPIAGRVWQITAFMQKSALLILLFHWQGLAIGTIVFLSFLTAYLYMLNRLETEEHLRSTKELAEQSNQAKSNFLAMMSHEIRTPMNTVVGITDVLIENAHNKEEGQYLETLKTASNSLLGIIDNILDMTRIESGFFELSYQNFNFKELVTEVCNLSLMLAQNKGLDFSFTMSDNLPQFITSDPKAMRHILSNTLSNAIKFTEEGKIILKTEIREEADKQWLSFSIYDEGIGIKEGMLDNIFQLFTQADSSITRKYGGTGIGLSIVKKYTELLGGEIQVKSTQGQGTEFSFHIPLLNLPQEKQVCGPNLCENHSSTQAIKKILSVDDCVENQKIIQLFLKKGPYNVTLASSGQECLNQIKQNNYDLILMDIQMPEMDGLETTRKIRQWEKAKQHHPIPIIALTAHAFLEDKRNSFNAGCNEHITKPIKKDALLAILAKYF